MSERLRAGIVGAGFMARVHSRAVRDAGHEVAAIASSTYESAKSAAAELNIPAVFENWQALVNSPNLDVIHICTPNEFHAEIAAAAARAGKHIVCEKPISVSLSEALEIQAEVSGSSVGFAVPFAYRFYPIVREIRSRILSGEAGPLHLIHGSYLQDWLANEESSNWRVDSVAGGRSRAFADIGTHWCDLMEFVSGDRIKRLMANTSTAYDSRNGKSVLTEDVASVIFETESGASGSLTVSQVSHGRKNRLWIELDGSRASYTFNQEQPDSVLVGGQNSNQLVAAGSTGAQSEDARRLSRVPAGHPQGYQDAFNSFVADAYRGFNGFEVEGVAGLADGVRAAALVEAVLESATSKNWVDVTPVESLLEVSK